jgi:hypothetical protein
MLGQNYVAELNPHILTFPHPIFIFTADGIALRTPSLTRRKGKKIRKKNQKIIAGECAWGKGWGSFGT